MALHAEINPSSEYQEGNPYVAHIFTEDDFETGRVRIEPPCQVGEHLIDMLKRDVGVELEPQVSGQEASIFGFYIDLAHAPLLNPDTGKAQTDLERTSYTVRSLLDELGKVANLNLLKKEYRIAD